MLKVKSDNVRLSDFIDSHRPVKFKNGCAFYESTECEDLLYLKEIVLLRALNGSTTAIKDDEGTPKVSATCKYIHIRIFDYHRFCYSMHSSMCFSGCHAISLIIVRLMKQYYYYWCLTSCGARIVSLTCIFC